MIPRLVPTRRVLRIAAWMAFWPVAFTTSGVSLVAALYIIGAFIPLVVRRKGATTVGSVAVASAVTMIERAFLPYWVALTIGGGVLLLYEWFLRTACDREDEPLDASARALAPFALVLATFGVFTAHGAQVAHLHAMFPRIAEGLVGVAVLAAVASAIVWRALGRVAARVYAGDDPARRVRKVEGDVRAPRLSDVALSDAAIVEGAPRDAGPYRAGEGRAIARVPSDPSVLARRHRRLLGEAIGVALLCTTAIALVLPSFAKVAHRADLASIPTTLPPLPGECRGQRVKLRFVALAPLRVLDVEEIADRYRKTGIAETVVESPLELDTFSIDKTRGQIAGEEITRAARKRYQPRRDELVVVVTDHDMFLRNVDWRYAFATTEGGVAVVSLARMDPNFPLLAPSTYEPAASECRAPVRARAFRMITRQILRNVCSAEMVDDPKSARRRAVMSLSDLDAVDEATY